MSPFVVSLCIGAAVYVAAIIFALRRRGYFRFEVQIPYPDPEEETEAEQPTAPRSPPVTATPNWLAELAALGFGTFESADTSMAARTPQAGYAICVGPPHPYNACSSCNAKAIRMLGETCMAAEKDGDRIFWIGSVCGRCGSVDLTSPNAPRFLNLLLADSRSMLTLVTWAQQHAGKQFNEIVTAMLQQNEGVLQGRINRSSALRAALPVEKLAKVLVFQRDRKSKKRRRDQF